MTDAIVLLAISQLVCLAALAYLYMEIQRLRHDARPRAKRLGQPRNAVRQAAAQAYGGSSRSAASAFGHDPAAIAARMDGLGVDVPTLARRMNRSEEEVRLLLRRQGVTR